LPDRSKLTIDRYATHFSLFLCGIDTSLFPRKALSRLRGVIRSYEQKF
jgi:hypothetical protein